MNEFDYFKEKEILEAMQLKINMLQCELQSQRNETNTAQDERNRAKEECDQRGAAIAQMQGSLAFRLVRKMQRLASILGARKMVNILRRIKNGKQIPAPAIAVQPEVAQPNAEYDFNNMLTTPEFVFANYKAMAEKALPLSLTEVKTACVQGLVSIILPVYNGDDMVEESIQSVLAQTYANFEFIIVNDGSTDTTASIIDRYAAKDSRIRAVHQQNQKLPKTLSNGFEIAKGEYFTWTSADNVMHRDFVQKLVDEMNAHPETDMVYANIRLIDEKGEVINDNKWYPDNACPENVLLPHCILELNTYANNFVAAAFMYKASVAHALSSAYSTNRYTTEDYDYWMRVNEMFNLRHVSFNDAIYDYRFHSKSLTAQDKELKISENRYRLMLWEDFRRGYLLKPMNWVVDCENKNDKLYKSFIESITIAGHNIIDKKKAAELCQSDYTRAVYINFDAAKKAENYIANAYNICVCDEPCSDIDAKWDCLISRQEVNCGDFLAAHKGWFSFANGKAMFAYITRKAKDAILFHLETAVEQGTEYKKDISIVLTYDVDLNALRIATMSLTQQDYPLDAIEVVVVSTEEAREEVLELFDTICQQKMLPESFFRFVATDANNFTERNNCGAWASTGKYIAFMDSLTYVEPQYIKNIFAVFTLYPKAAAVCGSVKARAENIDESATECVLLKSIDEYKGKGVLCYNASELFLFGGFTSMSAAYCNSFANSGWELTNIAKTLLHKHQIVSTSAVCAYRIYNVQPSEEAYKQRLFNRYYLEKQGLAPLNLSFPEKIKNNAEWMNEKLKAFKDYDNADVLIDSIYERDACEALMQTICDDFAERCDADAVRSAYKCHPLSPKEKAMSQLEFIDYRGYAHAGNPAVSIIVPIYRVEQYLHRCVDTIIAQTLNNIEIILVDDGSPDTCPQICDEYAAKDSRIKVIHKPNGGLSDARNAGIDIAKGEYLAFIDSDDWIEQDMFEKMLYAALVCDAQICECSFDNVYKDKIVPETKETGKWVVGDRTDALNGQIDWKYFKSLACDKLYSSSLFSDGKRYPVGKHHEDEFFTHKVYYEITRIVFVDYSFYHYDHTRDDSITGATFNVAGLDSVEALRERTTFFKERNETALYNRMLDLYCWTTLDRIDKCKQNDITGPRVEEIKAWLKADLPSFKEVGLSAQKIKLVEEI